MTPLRTNCLSLALLLITCTFAHAGIYDVLNSSGGDLLYDDLMADMGTLYAQREVSVAASLQSVAALQARQTQLRNDFQSLIGYLPSEKTDLNAEVTGTVNVTGQNYKIEKIVYESRPGHHVTANLYLPLNASETNTVPAVLVACGHNVVDSKSAEAYQSACILMAQNGMAALIYDPAGQGERAQIYNEPAGTTEHTMMGVGSRTLGMNFATYEIWDGVRGLDYLTSRSEIDTTKIGMAGNSGGGTQATWMMAYDDRITAATPSCFISSRKGAIEAGRIQDCEQHYPNQTALLIDHADFLTMSATKSIRILAAEQDYFPIECTRATYEEAQDVYSLLGAGNSVDLFTYNDTHGWSEPRREASVQWFRKCFFGDSSPVSEPYNQPVLDPANLLCTSTGQVTTSYADEKVVTDFNLERANELQSQRTTYWSTHTDAECREMVAGYLSLPEDRGTETVTSYGTIDHSGYTIEKVLIERDNEVPIPALICVPDGAGTNLPATVYVNGDGKATQTGTGGRLESLVNAGQIVISVDLSGFGETEDTTVNAAYNNEECNNAYIAQDIGNSLVSRRIEDIMVAVDVLLEQDHVDNTQISLIGVGKASTAVMHAAALDTRIAHVELENPTVTSWVDDVVSHPLSSNLLGHVVPGALNYYDLPDLERLMPNAVLGTTEFTKKVYHWKFDGNFAEESGTYNGTTIGNPTLGASSGAFSGSGAVYFDGDNDAISISQEVLGEGSFSLVFWARTYATGTTGYFFSDSENSSNLFARRIDKDGDSRLSGWIDEINFGNIGPDGYGSGSWAFGEWNQHAIIYNEETCRQEWYVNGELVRELVPDDFEGLTSDFYLGNRATLDRDFRGWIDDLQIYNWALSEENILALFSDPGSTIPEDIPGDANRDGVVDGSDATILANYWQYGVGMTNPDATWEMGDFNEDGVVDGSDATLLASHWQEGSTGSGSSAANTVPEPSGIVLLLAGLGGLFFLRHRPLIYG